MKTYQQFIQEGRSKEQQYKGSYEMLQQKYNKEYQDLKDVKPYKPTQGIKVKTAQIVPTKSNDPIDTRTTEEKGKNVKGKAYTAKMTNTWDRFKGP